MKKYFGNKAFYKMTLAVVLPIILQNGISNFVGLLDNIMVGRIGTEQMSGVSIANQLMFVYNLAIFGAVSGAGIFCAQFYGCKNNKGVQQAFRFKLILCGLISVIGIVVFSIFGESLINLFLQGNADAGDIALALESGRKYLLVMLIGVIPFAIVQSYSGTLRETGETVLPMKAGILAVCINLALNFVLIYGYFGFPKMGVIGAAVATVISRFVELFVVVIWTHRHTEKNPFVVGLYKNFSIPPTLAWNITKKATPLMMNEFLWSLGMTTMLQCYSVRGLSVVAGMNICTTLSNLFSVVYQAMGVAISIIIGQMLGAGKIEEAKETDRKLIAFALMSCLGFAIILGAIAPFFPKIYATGEDVQQLATTFILIVAICMPLQTLINACYFTIRSGGKTLVTFLFDSFYVWVFNIPLAFILSRYTDLPIVPLYFICSASDIVKGIIGMIVVKRGKWAMNLVSGEK